MLIPKIRSTFSSVISTLRTGFATAEGATCSRPFNVPIANPRSPETLEGHRQGA